jgi:hypothetical protein
MIRNTFRFFSTASSVAALIAIPLLAVPSFASTAFIVHGGTDVGATAGGVVARLNLNTGLITPLGIPLPGAGLTGVAFVGNRLYASTSDNSLIEINPTTGNLISNTLFSGAGFNPSSGDRIIDLATSPAGTLYAVRGIAGAPSSWALQTVNPSTAVLTNIGVLPDNGGGFSAIAFATNGNLYAQQTNITGFNQINPATGASVQNIAGGVPGGALGLGFDPDSGMLIASECCGGSDGSRGERIFSINPATGVAVQLFDFNDGRRIHDLAFASVPEPSSAVMTCMGFAAIAISRRRRRLSS